MFLAVSVQINSSGNSSPKWGHSESLAAAWVQCNSSYWKTARSSFQDRTANFGFHHLQFHPNAASAITVQRLVWSLVKRGRGQERRVPRRSGGTQNHHQVHSWNPDVQSWRIGSFSSNFCLPRCANRWSWSSKDALSQDTASEVPGRWHVARKREWSYQENTEIG